MTRFAQRSTEPEWMDDDGLDGDTFAAVLADLAQVNSVTLARHPTLAFVERVLRGVPEETPVTILDVGFGDGDMLRALASRLRHRQALRLVGYDINPRSAPAARTRTSGDLPIDYVTGDAFALDPAERIDIIISSLVTHHMRDEEIVRFLRFMETRAVRGWFVNDLHRSAIAYHGFRILAGAARWHPIVRHDGALSVARSFTRADWVRLIAQAGLDPSAVRIAWHFPFRWCVGRVR